MHRVIVVVDQDNPNNPAFVRACAIAGENCADLGILQLRNAGTDLESDPHSQFLKTMAAARALNPCIGSIAVSAVSRNANAIVQAAEAAGGDLLVMRNTIDTAVPHDAPFTLIDRVIHCTTLPVLAVQNPPHAPYRHLVALTGSGSVARQSIELALDVKSAHEIYALHASDENGGASEDAGRLDQLVAAITASRPDVSVNIHAVARTGDVSTALIRTWEEYRPDLIVAVTSRRRGLRALLGSSHVRDLLENMPFDLLIQEAIPYRHAAGADQRRAAGRQCLPSPSGSVSAQSAAKEQG